MIFGISFVVGLLSINIYRFLRYRKIESFVRENALDLAGTIKDMLEYMQKNGWEMKGDHFSYLTARHEYIISEINGKHIIYVFADNQSKNATPLMHIECANFIDSFLRARRLIEKELIAEKLNNARQNEQRGK